MTVEATAPPLAQAPALVEPARPAPPPSHRHGAPGTAAVFTTMGVLLPLLLAGYALLDRGFVRLQVGGITPLAGEAVIALGVVAAVTATGQFRVALQRSRPLLLLLVFCAWGAARTIPSLRTYGIDAIRDSSLWYDSLIAVIVFCLVQANQNLAVRWARGYAFFVVPVLLWSPVALLFSSLASPVVPGTDVPFFSHKPGNVAVATVTALAFLWLVPIKSVTPRRRALLTAMATLILLASGTQNRGGMVAGLAAVGVIAALARRRGRTLAGTMLATAAVSLVLGWGLNIHTTVGQSGREISVSQLVQNLSSVAGGSGDASQLGATVEFRNDLWSGVIDLARANGALVSGLGFGRNLALDLGLAGQATDPLRSPHNSHVDVLARMGLIGAAIWIAFWAAWYTAVVRRLLRSAAPLAPLHRGLAGVCVVGVTAILVNAYFDPTLESPQVALWLWTLAGLGLALVAPPLRARPRLEDGALVRWRAAAAGNGDAGHLRPTTPPVPAGIAPRRG